MKHAGSEQAPPSTPENSHGACNEGLSMDSSLFEGVPFRFHVGSLKEPYLGSRAQPSAGSGKDTQPTAYDCQQRILVACGPGCLDVDLGM